MVTRGNQTWYIAGLLMVLFIGGSAGCARQRYVTLRQRKPSPVEATVGYFTKPVLKPSERTDFLLRRYDLVKQQEKQPEVVLASLREQIVDSPSADQLCAFSELAFIEGKRLENKGKQREALDQYGASVATAYRFLFDPILDPFRNPYDPQFRRACDLYNGALEAGLRIIVRNQQIRPGDTLLISTGEQQYKVEVEMRGAWKADEIDHFEFVSDYELTSGLTNQHHNFGLGVPLIAVRKKASPETNQNEKYYPPGLSFPVTAFLRVSPESLQPSAPQVRSCSLELHDPLSTNTIEVCNRLIPLETDLTVPLAYFLDNPEFQQNDDPTFGLLNPKAAQARLGMYMVEPYDPNKIPVIMVHGLWSSPATWMEMFNDLRSFPEIRSRYQFWFFQYPTGQPFCASAVNMREVLAEVRRTLDPTRRNPNLDEMVLVGHSMGGLVSKLQVLESGTLFWDEIAKQPFEQLSASEEDRARLQQMFFFGANPSIKKVITLGTPHRGSTFANDYVRFASQKLITLPDMMVELTNKVVRQNPDLFKDTHLLTTSNSLDSLSPENPMLGTMLRAQPSPYVQFYNFVGDVPRTGITGKLLEAGDGVVSLQSATIDPRTDIRVEADHLTIHRHAKSILAVRDILWQHLRTVDSQRQLQFANQASALPTPRRTGAASAILRTSATTPVNMTISSPR